MTKLVDISFTPHSTYTEADQLIVAHRQGKGYLDYIRSYLTATVIGYIAKPALTIRNDVLYVLFKGKRQFWSIPLTTFLFVRRMHPDVVLIQGLVFPLQIILLRRFLKKNCVILVQDHGNLPFQGLRKLLQRIADHSIHAYLFTTLENADPWRAAKVIGPGKRCFELLEGATDLQRQNKASSKAILGLRGQCHYLWVGRLEANKDPLTVVRGFAAYQRLHPSAVLYMIYQTEELLPQLRILLNEYPGLIDAVYLIGAVPHAALSVWYSAADYFLSGSHKEGSGFALIESMTCGCIPVVTDIPPFRKITAGFGLLYEPGNPDGLYEALNKSGILSLEETSALVAQYAAQALTFKAIADNLVHIIHQIL